MEFYSTPTTTLEDAARNLEVYRLVQTYSKDYCIRSLGVSESEYAAAVNEEAIKNAESDRENTGRASRLMSQVVGKEANLIKSLAA